MKLVESNVEATRAKLTMDSEEDGQSAMTLQLLAGLVGDSSEIGDVSLSLVREDVDVLTKLQIRRL